MTPHTPTPWLYYKNHPEHGSTIWTDHGTDESVIVAEVVPDHHGQTDANAAFIVTACNAHAALKAQLRIAVTFLAAMDDPGLHPYLANMEAALALADGKERTS